MKNDFFAKFTKIARDTGRVGYALSGKMFARMRQMSWLQIAAAGVGVLLAIVILHLALFLFLLFMAIKLALVCALYASGKKAAAPHSVAEPYIIDMESPPRANTK